MIKSKMCRGMIAVMTLSMLVMSGCEAVSFGPQKSDVGYEFEEEKHLSQMIFRDMTYNDPNVVQIADMLFRPGMTAKEVYYTLKKSECDFKTIDFGCPLSPVYTDSEGKIIEEKLNTFPEEVSYFTEEVSATLAAFLSVGGITFYFELYEEDMLLANTPLSYIDVDITYESDYKGEECIPEIRYMSNLYGRHFFNGAVCFDREYKRNEYGGLDNEDVYNIMLNVGGEREYIIDQYGSVIYGNMSNDYITFSPGPTSLDEATGKYYLGEMYFHFYNK